ncbi:MAG: sensor histidine kinase [Candidatus Cryptobacteroides sp.]
MKANVLLYWPTDESDPVYIEWTKIAERELRRQGIHGEVSVHFAHATERYETVERPMLNELILHLRAQGKMPDLILSYGDANRWLLVTDVNSVAASIPVVCYGTHFEDYLPYQEELLLDNYDAGRWDMVTILDRLRLKENLDFADSLSPSAVKALYRPEYISMYPHRFITLLDVENLWTDRIRYNDLCSQMALLDPDIYYDNLQARVNEDVIRNIARDQKRIVFSCRSVMSPQWNLSPSANQVPTTWAFFPQKSANFFIQGKHDNKSRTLVDSPSFMPYFTMIAHDFLVNDKCIGGYFTPYEEQIRDAVSAGKRLLRGETPKEIGTLEHRPSYNINWDVVRGFGLDVNKVPQGVNLHNVTLRDRNPGLYGILKWTIIIVLVSILIWSAIITWILSGKARDNAVKMRRYAENVIYNNGLMKRIMEITEFSTWEMNDGFNEDYSRISASDFFMEKLRKFFAITVPGNYAIQAYCSLDRKPAHWYMIRMTVAANGDGTVSRKGIIVNNDKQKELEAVAAETNRLITSVRTREGFIASMNHEIRTPLNSIVGYSQLLSMPGMEFSREEFGEYIEAIGSNSSVLRHTMDNIMTANLISRNMTKSRPETIFLADFLRPWTGLGAEGTYGRRIVLQPGPEGLSVSADRMMLTKVMDNLLDNAIRFSDAPSAVTVGWDRSDAQGCSAEIWVRDEGMGIEPKYHKLIFERFFKVDSFTSGCGLGLYIARTFVELMGGRISVGSRPGSGSVFKIRLK